MRPNVDQRADRLSLLHIGITEKAMELKHKTDEQTSPVNGRLEPWDQSPRLVIFREIWSRRRLLPHIVTRCFARPARRVGRRRWLNEDSSLSSFDRSKCASACVDADLGRTRSAGAAMTIRHATARTDEPTRCFTEMVSTFTTRYTVTANEKRSKCMPGTICQRTY